MENKTRREAGRFSKQMDFINGVIGMDIHYQNIQIRNAAVSDAEQICAWWNDGAVMAHAGFPKGLGTTLEKVIKEIEGGNDRNRLCILLSKGVPIGEMNYRIAKESKTAQIGIKICDASNQNHGLGKLALSLFIRELFSVYGISKITVDTSLKNERAQHVYEQLGFQKTAVEVDSWRDQLGQLQSAVLYELTPENFRSYIP